MSQNTVFPRIVDLVRIGGIKEGLYIDGELIYEDAHLTAQTVLLALRERGIIFGRVLNADRSILTSVGQFPLNLDAALFDPIEVRKSCGPS